VLDNREESGGKAKCEGQQRGTDDGLPKAREKLFLVPVRVGEARRRSPLWEYEIGGRARCASSALAKRRQR
jgi:hypothetical protein